MKPTAKFWLCCGAVLAGLAVALGAFAAHGLEKSLLILYPPSETRTIAGLTVPAAWKYLQDFKTGAEYQLTHAIALLVIGLLARDGSRRALEVAGWSFLLGSVFFSGSLYALTLTGVKAWGAVAPMGGILFLVGWASLAVAVTRSSNSCSHSSSP